MDDRISLDRDLYSNKLILVIVLIGAFIFPGLLFFINYAPDYLMHWLVVSVLGIGFFGYHYETKREQLQ